MGELINHIISFIGQFGYFSGFLLVFLESMIPVLPLSVFVALNVFTYGNIAGYIVSYLGSIMGCITAYYLCVKFDSFFKKKYKDNKHVKEIKNKIRNINVPTLVIILAIPFTPAFAINIAAGLTRYDFKKYLIAIIIGKIPMIYFWAFIGASLKESLTDISILARIVGMLIITYLVSKVISKLLNK